MTLRTDQTNETLLEDEHPLDHRETNTQVNANTAAIAALLTRVLPPGGLAGQVLAKLSTDDYDVDWASVIGGGGSGKSTVSIVVAPYGSLEPADITCSSASDNGVDINLAIQAANALPNGGTVYLKAGTYAISNSHRIIPKSNVRLAGEGLATILYNESGNVGLDDISGATIIHYTSGADVSDFGVEDLTFEGDSTSASTSCAIYMTGELAPENPTGPSISGFYMRNVNFRHTTSLPVRLFGFTGKLVTSGCEFIDTKDAGYGFNDEVIFVGNHSLDSKDNGWSLSRGNRKVTCVGNTSENATYWGIWIGGFAGNSGPLYVTVAGNVVKNSKLSCIGAINAPKNLSIVGNVLDQNWNRPGTDSDISGIQIAGVTGAGGDRAKNITISGNTIMNAAKAGVTYKVVDNMSITGNTIINCGTQYLHDGTTPISSSDTTSNAGVLCLQVGTMTNVWIDGNLVVDDRSTKYCNWDFWKLNTTGVIYGVNYSSGMRNQRNTWAFSQEMETGVTPQITMSGPDSAVGLIAKLKGSADFTVINDGQGSINTNSPGQGSGGLSKFRWSNGAPSAHMATAVAVRRDLAKSATLSLNSLANGDVSGVKESAPFYIRGSKTDSGHMLGLNGNVIMHYAQLGNFNWTTKTTDVIMGYTGQTVGHQVFLPSACGVAGQILILKDEENKAASFNITLTPVSAASQSFSSSDVDATADTIALATPIETGTPVTLSGAGSPPGGLSFATTYYVANKFVLYNTAAFTGTVVSDSSGGSTAWTNPSNATATDNTFATWLSPGTASPVTSEYLKATNFGFAIPSTATIEGVVVKIKQKGTTNNTTLVYDESIQLVEGGVIGSNDYATGTALFGTVVEQVFGSNTDQWGLSLTPADVNASDFGVAYQVSSIAGTASIDSIHVTVYYSMGSNIYLSTSLANALASTTINITSQGSGSMTIDSPAQTVDGLSTKVISANGGYVGIYSDGTNWHTMFESKVTQRTGTTTSSATPTINTNNLDFYSITALAVNITSFTTNLSGTPNEAQELHIAITDNGTARSIAWGTSFEASTVALPTTTVISTRLDVHFIWNTVTSKWRCISAV